MPIPDPLAAFDLRGARRGGIVSQALRSLLSIDSEELKL